MLYCQEKLFNNPTAFTSNEATVFTAFYNRPWLQHRLYEERQIRFSNNPTNILSVFFLSEILDQGLQVNA